MPSTEKDKQSQYYLSRINTQVLNYNVYIMSSTEKKLYTALCIICGGVVGLVFYGGLFKADGVATILTRISDGIVFLGVGLLAVKFIMPMITDNLRKKRIRTLREQFVNFAASLTNALATGMNMHGALETASADLKSQYSDEAFIVREVQELIDGVYNNIPIETMLEDFGERSGIDDIKNFAIVFQTCYRTGGDIKSVVRRTTDIISEKVMIASEIETMITSNKMQMNVMVVLPIVIILMMRIMSSTFAESFGSLIGVLALTVSVGLFIAAYKLGQKYTNIGE